VEGFVALRLSGSLVLETLGVVINLQRLKENVIWVRFLNFKDEVIFVSNFNCGFELLLAQITVEGFPGVGSNLRAVSEDVFGPSKPGAETV